MFTDVAQQISVFGQPALDVLSETMNRPGRARGYVLSSPDTLQSLVKSLEAGDTQDGLTQYCNRVKMVLEVCLSAVRPPPEDTLAWKSVRSHGLLGFMADESSLYLPVMGLLSNLQEIITFAHTPRRARAIAAKSSGMKRCWRCGSNGTHRRTVKLTRARVMPHDCILNFAGSPSGARCVQKRTALSRFSPVLPHNGQ